MRQDDTGVLMGAISMNLPSIYVPGGAMLRGNWRGETLGSGTDVWKYWAERRAGNLDEDSGTKSKTVLPVPQEPV